MFWWPHGGHGERARARAGYGVRRWARGWPGRASAERFAASQRRTGLEGFEATSERLEKKSAPARERTGRQDFFRSVEQPWLKRQIVGTERTELRLYPLPVSTILDRGSIV